MNRFCHSMVDFQPTELRRIKKTLIEDAAILAGKLCEPVNEVRSALNSGTALVGTLNDRYGKLMCLLNTRGHSASHLCLIRIEIPG